MLGWRIKTAVSDMAGSLVDLDALIARKRNRNIIAFHRILPGEAAGKRYLQKSMWTSTETFEAQIRWMLNIGEIVDIKRILDLGEENRSPLFSITFDDGWKDNYEHAFPILKKYGVKATVFLATSAIETGDMLWPEELIMKTEQALRTSGEIAVRESITSCMKRLRGLKGAGKLFDLVDEYLEALKVLAWEERERCVKDYYASIGADDAPIKGQMLSWDEVLEMEEYGIEFGSHTHTHAILKYLDDEETRKELALSKEVLERRLRKKIDLFCYPNARYKDSDARLLKEAGYSHGFRLHNMPFTARHSPYLVPRILSYESIYENENFFKLRLLGIERVRLNG